MYRIYNEEMKQRYIKEKNKSSIISAYYLECQFDKVSSMEKEYGKDVSNFTVYEIIEYYKMLNLSSLDSIVVMNSHFSMYTQWCLQENSVVDNQNHFLEMTMDMLKGCLNKMLVDMKIISRDIILDWVSQLPNPRDQFILLGLFEGLKGKGFCELARLKPEDIIGNTAHLYTGRTIQISNELISIARNCVEEDKYYSISGRGIKTMPLICRGYIIKDYPNAREDVSDFQLGRKIYNSITRVLDYFDMKRIMSANTITESGKIYMIKERAKILRKTSKNYIYSDYIKEVEEKYDFRMIRSTFWLKYEEYLK